MYCVMCGEKIMQRVVVKWVDKYDKIWNPHRHGMIAVCLKQSCVDFFRKNMEKSCSLSKDEDMFINGYCKVCGEKLVINFNRWHRLYKHKTCSSEVTSQIYSRNKTRKNKKLNEVPLKPWEDPESLFCDTAFLSNLCEKEISTGDECRGK